MKKYRSKLSVENYCLQTGISLYSPAFSVRIFLLIPFQHLTGRGGSKKVQRICWLIDKKSTLLGRTWVFGWTCIATRWTGCSTLWPRAWSPPACPSGLSPLSCCSSAPSWATSPGSTSTSQSSPWPWTPRNCAPSDRQQEGECETYDVSYDVWRLVWRMIWKLGGMLEKPVELSVGRTFRILILIYSHRHDRRCGHRGRWRFCVNVSLPCVNPRYIALMANGLWLEPICNSILLTSLNLNSRAFCAFWKACMDFMLT